MTRTVTYDRCPGVLRPYLAVDGNMVRFRCPGGFITAEQLTAVMALAVEHANSEVQVTSRNNLQIRALPEPLPSSFVAEAFATGLMPDAAHERVRTIICSPLTSVAPHHCDLGAVSRTLDHGLISTVALADLPGRFLFVLDDGRGDVLAEAFDIGAQAQADGTFAVFVGGCESSRRVSAENLVETMLAIALRFVENNRSLAKPAWHTRELADPSILLEGFGEPCEVVRPASERPVELGAIEGAASVAIPLGLLTPAQAEALANVATRANKGNLILTPWRGAIIPGAAEYLDELAAAGLVTSSGSVWSTLSACYGLPCNNAKCDTRAIADEVARRASGPFKQLVHISGCDRVCGEPGGEHLSMVAPADAATVLSAALG